jgi:membrane protein implicated in regulation of membrane protease activity
MKGAAMNPESKAMRRAEIIDEVSKWGVGLGVVTVALFPLSIPFLLLTAVALLPLLVPVLALGLIGGIVALPVLLVRRLVRRRRSPQARGGRRVEAPTAEQLTPVS